MAKIINTKNFSILQSKTIKITDPDPFLSEGFSGDSGVGGNSTVSATSENLDITCNAFSFNRTKREVQEITRICNRTFLSCSWNNGSSGVLAEDGSSSFIGNPPCGGEYEAKETNEKCVETDCTWGAGGGPTTGNTTGTYQSNYPTCPNTRTRALQQLSICEEHPSVSCDWDSWEFYSGTLDSNQTYTPEQPACAENATQYKVRDGERECGRTGVSTCVYSEGSSSIVTWDSGEIRSGSGGLVTCAEGSEEKQVRLVSKTCTRNIDGGCSGNEGTEQAMITTSGASLSSSSPSCPSTQSQVRKRTRECLEISTPTCTWNAGSSASSRNRDSGATDTGNTATCPNQEKQVRKSTRTCKEGTTTVCTGGGGTEGAVNTTSSISFSSSTPTCSNEAVKTEVRKRTRTCNSESVATCTGNSGSSSSSRNTTSSAEVTAQTATCPNERRQTRKSTRNCGSSTSTSCSGSGGSEGAMNTTSSASFTSSTPACSDGATQSNVRKRERTCNSSTSSGTCTGGSGSAGSILTTSSASMTSSTPACSDGATQTQVRKLGRTCAEGTTCSWSAGTNGVNDFDTSSCAGIPQTPPCSDGAVQIECQELSQFGTDYISTRERTGSTSPSGTYEGGAGSNPSGTTGTVSNKSNNPQSCDSSTVGQTQDGIQSRSRTGSQTTTTTYSGGDGNNPSGTTGTVSNKSSNPQSCGATTVGQTQDGIQSRTRTGSTSTTTTYSGGSGSNGSGGYTTQTNKSNNPQTCNSSTNGETQEGVSTRTQTGTTGTSTTYDGGDGTNTSGGTGTVTNKSNNPQSCGSENVGDVQDGVQSRSSTGSTSTQTTYTGDSGSDGTGVYTTVTNKNPNPQTCNASAKDQIQEGISSRTRTGTTGTSYSYEGDEGSVASGTTGTVSNKQGNPQSCSSGDVGEIQDGIQQRTRSGSYFDTFSGNSGTGASPGTWASVQIKSPNSYICSSESQEHDVIEGIEETVKTGSFVGSGEYGGTSGTGNAGITNPNSSVSTPSNNVFTCNASNHTATQTGLEKEKRDAIFVDDTEYLGSSGGACVGTTGTSVETGVGGCPPGSVTSPDCEPGAVQSRCSTVVIEDTTVYNIEERYATTNSGGEDIVDTCVANTTASCSSSSHINNFRTRCKTETKSGTQTVDGEIDNEDIGISSCSPSSSVCSSGSDIDNTRTVCYLRSRTGSANYNYSGTAGTSGTDILSCSQNQVATCNSSSFGEVARDCRTRSKLCKKD